MTAGRPHKFPPCSDCGQPVKAASSPYFECACRGYIAKNGKLHPTRPRAKPKPVEILLSRRGEVVTGAWVIDWVATAHYSTPRVEKEAVYCSVEEFEELVS